MPARMWSVLAIATLVTWLIAGAAGIYMFGTWLSHGGPGQQRARSDGLPPAVIFTHLGFGALGFAGAMPRSLNACLPSSDVLN